MEHTNEGFTLDFTQKNENSIFVAQMFQATNVIPFKSIQSQTLETQIRLVREWKDIFIIQFLDFDKKEMVGGGKRSFSRMWLGGDCR